MSFPSTIDDQPVKQDVRLAPYTTYRIGGPAEYYIQVSSQGQLASAVEVARAARVPFFVLGAGANILIKDEGIPGLVIHNRADHASIKGHRLMVESGAVVADLIELTARDGLSGLEHFAGIPSSVGGAMRQNLHFLSPDRQRTLFIEEFVGSAEILNESGQIFTADREYFHFGYDESILHHNQDVVLSVTFELEPQAEAAIRQQAELNRQWRQQRQPPVDTFPSCGSVFKKIAGVGAGRLIDRAGLKGRQIGQAQISPKHANFIVNLGGATAADVLALVDLVQSEVYKQTGYQLEMEIGVVGGR